MTTPSAFETRGAHAPAVLGRRQALAALSATLLSCHYTKEPRQGPVVGARRIPQRPPVVVLVAIDGARWQDVYLGPSEKGAGVAKSREELIPHLVDVERQGASYGAPGASRFLASGPNFVSLPGYMEMLSGVQASECTSNECSEMVHRTLLDDFNANHPDDPTRTGVFSSWPRVAIAASRYQRGIVSAGRFAGTHQDALLNYSGCRLALEAGRQEKAIYGDLRRDELTAALASSFLHEADPDFLFVSLGESDEAAHRGNYPAYLAALRDADAFIGEIRSELDAKREAGRETLLLVTTDHGRATNFNDHGRGHPESSQGFLFAEGTRIRPIGSVRPSNRERSLDSAYLKDIAPTVRALGGLPPGNTPRSGRPLHEIML